MHGIMLSYRQLQQRLGQRTTRRRFVFASAMSGALLATGGRATAQTPPSFGRDPFSLGVASGDPAADGFVLWTRLAPDPLTPGGGMPTQPVDVQWQVGSDDQMRNIVQRGTASASPDWAHSVHVEVSGLEPNRWYWYQFKAGDAVSPIGRTRTAPAAGTTLDQFKFAFASCQKWSEGYFSAYRDLAAHDIDLVVFLGDYIYEYTIFGGVRKESLPNAVRAQTRSLKQYRLRYSLYKTDPELQKVHASYPWIVTWDDHEVMNDYAGDQTFPDSPVDEFLLRRAAAYQAYYEHQPLRATAKPKGSHLLLYRRLSYGDLLHFHVLDTRQYRSPLALSCDEEERAKHDGYCAIELDPKRTMLGATQKQWLLDGLKQSTAQWNVLAQQVLMAEFNTGPNPAEPSFGGTRGDKWDGYAVERDEIVRTMAGIAQQRPFHPVVLTGDYHRNIVNDLKTDWSDPSKKSVIGSEFLVTSVSSEGDDPLKKDGKFSTRCGDTAANPHQVFYDNHRGYVLCNVTADSWQVDYRALPSVAKPDQPAFTLASFTTEANNPGVHLATCAAHATPAAATPVTK